MLYFSHTLSHTNHTNTNLMMNRFLFHFFLQFSKRYFNRGSGTRHTPTHSHPHQRRLILHNELYARLAQLYKGHPKLTEQSDGTSSRIERAFQHPEQVFKRRTPRFVQVTWRRIHGIAFMRSVPACVISYSVYAPTNAPCSRRKYTWKLLCKPAAQRASPSLLLVCLARFAHSLDDQSSSF